MVANAPDIEPSTRKATSPEAVVMFDGECNLCSSFIDFCIRRDPTARLRFAPRQSEAGQSLLREHELPPDLESMVLYENGRAYTRSTAALRTFRHLRMPWPLLSVLLIVPKFVREPCYRLVAWSRYRLFGHRKTCRVPSAAERERFLG